MNIVIVSPNRPSPVSFDGTRLSLGREDCDVWLRSALSGLCSIPADLVIFLPGCSEEQKARGTERTRAQIGGRTVDMGQPPLNVHALAAYLEKRATDNHEHDGDPADKNEIASWIREFQSGELR